MRLIFSIIILLIVLKGLEKPLPFEKHSNNVGQGSTNSNSTLPDPPPVEKDPPKKIPVDTGKAPETIVLEPNPFAAFTR